MKPKHFEYCWDVMSNYDHKIDYEVAETIKGQPYYAGYPGWNFYGYVWWAEGKWHCEVWQYGSYKEDISEDTLVALKEAVSEKYGWD